MQYHVTIPALDLVDEAVVAKSPKKAVARAMTRDIVLDSLDFEEPMEAIVTRASGKKTIFDILPVLSFRLTKAGQG